MLLISSVVVSEMCAIPISTLKGAILNWKYFVSDSWYRVCLVHQRKQEINTYKTGKQDQHKYSRILHTIERKFFSSWEKEENGRNFEKLGEKNPDFLSIYNSNSRLNSVPTTPGTPASNKFSLPQLDFTLFSHPTPTFASLRPLPTTASSTPFYPKLTSAHQPVHSVQLPTQFPTSFFTALVSMQYAALQSCLSAQYFHPSQSFATRFLSRDTYD